MEKWQPVVTKNDPDQAGKLTAKQVRDLKDGWVLDGEIRQLSRRTLDERREVLGKLSWFLAYRELSHCGKPELRAFLAYVARGHEEPGGRWGNPRMVKPVSPRTQAAYFRVLHTFFGWVVEEDELAASPLASLKAPKTAQDQVQPFSSDQVEALLVAARESQDERRDEAILLFLLDTGVRVSELCSLAVRDIDLSARRCTVRGKGGKVRLLPFGRRTAKALWHYQNNPRFTDRELDQAFFVADQGPSAGVSITRHGLGKLITRLGKAAGVAGSRCSPHTFRHTFAVNFIRNGGNLFALQEILGHTTLIMVRRYVKLAEADIENQHRQFSPVDRMKRR